MKCVKLVGKKLLEKSEINDPEFGKGNVIISVSKAGICGSDIHNWDNGAPEGLVMGHEFVGRVIDAGSRADLNIGDRITALPISPCGKCEACKTGNPQYCPETWNNAVGLSLTYPGAYAEKTAMRPDLIVKIPDNMRDEEAAMVEPTAVALHAIDLANIKVGDHVLVIGAGIIGDLCAEIAKLNGAEEVVISEVNEKRGLKAVSLGCADKYYDAKKEDFMAKVLEDNPYGFDVVIDCSGVSAAVTTSLVCAKPNGKIVLVGISTDNISIPSALLIMKEQIVYGAIGYTEKEFRKCIDLISEKKLDVLKFVDKIVSLDEVQDAFLTLTSGNDDAIKILIDPNK